MRPRGGAVQRCGAVRQCASFLLKMKSSIRVVSLQPMPPHALSMMVRVRVRARVRVRVRARVKVRVGLGVRDRG